MKRETGLQNKQSENKIPSLLPPSLHFSGLANVYASGIEKKDGFPQQLSEQEALIGQKLAGRGPGWSIMKIHRQAQSMNHSQMISGTNC